MHKNKKLYVAQKHASKHKVASTGTICPQMLNKSDFKPKKQTKQTTNIKAGIWTKAMSRHTLEKTYDLRVTYKDFMRWILKFYHK